MTLDEFLTMAKLAATVAGATATVIGVVAKPLFDKLNRMEQGIDTKIQAMGLGLDGKLSTIGTTVDGIKTRVGEQNGRIGKMETWQQMHEAHDNERHEETQESRKELTAAINGLREQIQNSGT